MGTDLCDVNIHARVPTGTGGPPLSYTSFPETRSLVDDVRIKIFTGGSRPGPGRVNLPRYSSIRVLCFYYKII